MAAALTQGAQAFGRVMGQEATEGIEYSADAEGRLEAGFNEAEVRGAFSVF